MSGDKDYIDDLLTQIENRNFELKEAKDSFSFNELLKYCSAISNEGGGIIIFGIRDNKEIIGTKAFEDINSTEYSVYRDLNIKIILEEKNYEGKRILVCIVPKRNSGSPVAYKGAYFMRSGESLVPMTQDMLRDIFSESSGNYLERIAVDSIPAEDIVRTLDIDIYFKLLRKSVPTSLDEIMVSLLSDRVIKRSGDVYSITNLGMFALARTFEDIYHFRHKKLRIIRFDESSRVNAISDVFLDGGYAIAMVKAVDELLPALLPTYESFSSASRNTIKHYPLVALRELLANALFHQDLESVHSHPTIEIHPEYISIVNPGKPIIDIARFIDDNQSRNPELVSLMYKLGLCEARGTGMDRVLVEIELAQIAAPQIDLGDNVTRVTLDAGKKFATMSQAERVWATFMHCCRLYVQQDHMSNTSLRNRFGLPQDKTAQISQLINAAVSAKLIKNINPSNQSKRFTKYVPFFAVGKE